MKNKTLIILFVLLALLFISTISLATDNVKNTINSGTNAVVDGISNVASDIRNGVGTIEGAVQDGVNNLENGINSATSFTTASGTNYTATRTDVGLTNTNNTTGNMWTWIVLAIAAVVIVALVWYYSYQPHDNKHM